MFLEVIGLNAADVIAAQEGGADRVELVSDMAAAGLSPSVETIKEVIAVAKIPFRVMVRFHNNGFIYTEAEIVEMCEWMEQVKDLAFDGFVHQIAAIKVLEKHGVTTVLTSAGLKTPISDNIVALDELQKASKVEVLAGGGVNKAVIVALAETSVQNYHVGSCVRPDGDFTQTVSASLVSGLKNRNGGSR